MTPEDAPSQPERLAPERQPGRRLQVAAGILCVVVLALLYALPALPLAGRTALRVALLTLVAVFVAWRVGRLIRAPRWRPYLREHWMDLALLAGATLLAAAGLGFRGRILPAAAMYILFSRSWQLLPRHRLPRVLDVLLAVTGLAAVAALILEYGFRDPPPVPRGVLHAIQTVVVAMFILDRIVRLESARNRRAYMKDNWVDFALLTLAALAVGVGRQLHGTVLSAGTLYVIITQAYILISLVLRGVSVNLDFAGSGAPPTWLLIGSFALMCLVGSGLLMLPAAVPEGTTIYYADALFTATSATCVTGLIVRDTGTDFTPFGQAVILGLIQTGGLGIMLFGTVLALLVGKGLSLRSSDALGQIVGVEGVGRISRIVKFVVASTLAMELLGALLLYPMFASPQAAGTPTAAAAIWDSVFHSISSFCNAGFSLYGQNMMAGAVEGWSAPLRRHWQMMGVMAPLIVLGGLGFPVLEDCAVYAKARMRQLWRRCFSAAAAPRERRPRLSLHSKIVLSTSAILVLLGAAGLLLLGPERRPTGQQIGRVPANSPDNEIRDNPARWRNLSAGERVREALFQSITARTAGFNTVDMQDDLSDSGRLWMCGLMTIGGSPASTAGGMKTVTLAVLLLACWSMMRRRNSVEAFQRTVSEVLVRRATTLMVLYAGLLGLVTLLLCVTMPGQDFMRLLFEACSACGTVGLSTGITPSLTLPAKLVVIVGMFAGRLGPLTLLLALTVKMRQIRYSYPSEDLVIG